VELGRIQARGKEKEKVTVGNSEFTFDQPATFEGTQFMQNDFKHEIFPGLSCRYSMFLKNKLNMHNVTKI